MNKLKILYGNHKRSLLDSCLKQIADYNARWPDRRAFLIVPETAKADTERRYIENFDGQGLMMAEVLSFRRLAYRLFSEAGGLAVDYISPAGRAMLIQSIIRKNRSSFKRFGRYSERPGYAAAIDSVLGDFRRYGLDDKSISDAANSAGDQMFADKLKDFSFLISQFDSHLAKNDLIDRELDLDRLCELIDSHPERLKFLASTAVWIHGFGENRDFTAQEYRVIKVLREAAESVSVTVCSDIVPGEERLLQSGPAPFVHGRQSAFRLAAAGPVQAIMVKAARSEAFECLAEWLINEKAPEPEAFRDSIKLIRAEDKNQELHYVAGEIRRLISEENYRYRDIAVAICDLPAWQFSLQTVFREFNLEGFIDVQMPLSGTVLMRYVNSLLQIGRRGDRFESLMSLLRTGLTGAGLNETDQYENYCYAAGLPLRGRYRDDRYYSQSISGWQPALDFKKKYIDPVLEIARGLAKPADVIERTKLLEKYLTVDSVVLSRTEELVSRWNQTSEHHAASTLVQAWNSLLELFAEMRSIFSSQKLTLDSFTSVLSAGMSGSFSRIIPTGLDRIRISDTAHISQHSERVLFIVGANRNSFPAGKGAEGILLNSERQQLELLSGKAFPDMQRYHATGKANEVFTLLTSPSDYLYISCPSLQDRPSMYQQRFFDLLKSEIILKSDSLVDIRWNSPKRAARLSRIAIANDSSGEISGVDAFAIRAALKQAGYKLEISSDEVRKDPLHPSASENLSITADLVLQKYPDDLVTSISRLQKFRECPYSHYASYLLGLRERETVFQDFRTSGSILHSLVERAFSDLTERLGIAAASEKSIRDVYECWYRDINSKYIDNLYRQEQEAGVIDSPEKHSIDAGYGRILKRLAKSSIMFAATQIAPEDYMPAYQEWEFPSDEVSGLVLNARGRSIILRGKIDRVDIHSDGRHCRIIDYKSGRTGFDYTALYHGMNLQLPVYLDAFMQNNRELVPGEMGYFYFQRPVLTVRDTLASPNDDQLEKNAKKENWSSMSDRPEESLKLLANYAACKAAETAEQIFTGFVGARPSCLSDKAIACSWCSFKPLCNYDDRTVSDRRLVLDDLPLPEDADNQDMKKKALKASRIEYIEELMKQYIEERNCQTERGKQHEMDR